MQSMNWYMWYFLFFHIKWSRHARLWAALHCSAQPPSYPLSSAPQRFALAHQAPRESLLLAGGCGGSARDGGRLADGSLVCLMDWLMDAHCWLWRSSVVHIVSLCKAVFCLTITSTCVNAGNKKVYRTSSKPSTLAEIELFLCTICNSQHYNKR